MWILNFITSVENNSNTRCSWDKRNLNIYIHGEPKDAKQAYTILMAQMAKFAGANGTTAPDAMVNILGKEFVDGVCFCKLTDATEGDDSQDGSSSAKSKRGEPAVFVVHPIHMTDEEKQKGRILASELWRSAQFVTWNFKSNVIQDASMVLRRQLQRTPQGVGKYLKLEVFFQPYSSSEPLLSIFFRWLLARSSFSRTTGSTSHFKVQCLRLPSFAISVLIRKLHLNFARSGRSLGSHNSTVCCRHLGMVRMEIRSEASRFTIPPNARMGNATTLFGLMISLKERGLVMVCLFRVKSVSFSQC